MMDLGVVPYESKPEAFGSPAGNHTGILYRECMRNHAASIGGQAFDGCGEFMPSARGELLKCAACGCHRNFHRRGGLSGELRLPFLLPPPPLAVDRRKMGSETPQGMDGGDGTARKRSRTKFTAEQKEKMKAFGERVGWRIQKQDDVAMEELCAEIGVKRHVLKVWMHNNKNHHLSAAN